MSFSPQVIHVVPALFGESGIFGGAERYAYELAKAMSARVPTQLLAFGNREIHRQDGPLDIVVLPDWLRNKKGYEFNPFNPRMLNYLRRAKIIHYHQTYTLSASAALLFARTFGKRIFTTDLGGGGRCLHHYINNTNWYSGHLHLSQYSLRHAGQEKLATASVIYGGIDTDKFSPDSTVSRTNEVLFVGRLLPHKGINYLIEAIDPSLRLTIIGRQGKGSGEFYKLLRQLAEGRNVTFQENFDDAHLVSAYRKAMCVVLPSVYETIYHVRSGVPELLGQTLLEAMACGAPGLCTNVASMPEVVADGVTGFVVPPNNPQALNAKLHWFLEHPAESGCMGAAARQRVLNQFTWPRVVDLCLQAYGLAG